MTKEWKWRSKTGRAFLHAGVGVQDAVGAEQPGHAIPLGEGARLLFAKGVDRIWKAALILGAIRLLLPNRKRRR